MKIECLIYKKNGLPLPNPEVHEVESYHCTDGSCMVYFLSGGNILLTNASLHHSYTIDLQGGFLLGLSIHGIESCPELRGAGVSQELWLRVER